MVFMPESPHYLLTKNKDKKAAKALQRLRSPIKATLCGAKYSDQLYDPSTEVRVMKDNIQDEIDIGSISIKTMLTEEVYWKPLAIVMMLMFLQQFCGINAVLFYTQIIFEDAGSEMDPGETNCGVVDLALGLN